MPRGRRLGAERPLSAAMRAASRPRPGCGPGRRRPGARLRIEDDRSDPAERAAWPRSWRGRADLLFGPYGSGAARAVAEAMAGRPEVIWNHGGAAAAPHRRPRGRRAGPGGELLARSGRRSCGAAGATRPGRRRARARRLRRARWRAGRAPGAGGRGRPSRSPSPISTEARGPGGRRRRWPRAAGARWVVGGGRIEDDLALGRALAGAPACAAASWCAAWRSPATTLGDAVERMARPGAVGGEAAPRRRCPCPPGADYPAAQALAAGRPRRARPRGRRHPAARRPLGRGPRAAHRAPSSGRSRSTPRAARPRTRRPSCAGPGRAGSLRREVVWRPPAAA